MRVVVLGLCGVIAGVIVVGMLRASWAHRRASTPDSHFHKRLATEVVWAVLPCLMLLAGAVPAARLILESPITAPRTLPNRGAPKPADRSPDRLVSPSRDACPAVTLNA